MLDRSEVLGLIFKALATLNDERDKDSQIRLTPETRLFGVDAVLDSLSLVSVIVDVEQGVASASGRQVSLTDDRAMGQKVSPFATVSTLADYILTTLSEP